MTTRREGSEGTGLSAVPSFHCQTVNQANKVTIKRADSHPAGYLAGLSIYFLSKQDTLQNTPASQTAQGRQSFRPSRLQKHYKTRH